MAQLFKNNAYSALAASLTNVATTLTVTTGQGDRFPAVTAPDFFHLTLQDASNNIEVVKVTARTAGADSMTIERAQEGTSARAWNIGDVVELRLTASALNPLSLFEGGSTASALRTSLGLGTSATVNTGTSGAVIPLLNGNNVHSGNNTFTGNQTFRATDAVRVEAAQNQDAIVLRGRAGGTGGFAAVLTPAALAATRVYTMPDAGADASFVMTAGTQTLGGTYTFSNTITGSITGNAATATKLQTASTITIGNTGKSVDGSADVSWSLAEIGAAGFGVLADGTDLNTVVASGFYRLLETHGNAPPGVSHGQLIVSRGGGDTILQIVTGYSNGEIYWRQGNPPDVGGSGSWSAWHKFFHSGNLGAATESSAGIVELATAAEAQALASAVVALTPARLADAFKGANQSLVGNGYQKLPGGLIIQWGTSGVAPVDGSLDVTFPIAFPSNCAAVVAQQTIGTPGSAVAVPGWVVSAKSATGFTLRNDGGAQVFYWIAIGY
jgi:hypothetical protein